MLQNLHLELSSYTDKITPLDLSRVKLAGVNSSICLQVIRCRRIAQAKDKFLEVDALLDHLFRHVRSFVRSVVVAFRCGAYGGKSNSGGYGNLATVAMSLLLPKAS